MTPKTPPNSPYLRVQTDRFKIQTLAHRTMEGPSFNVKSRRFEHGDHRGIEFFAQFAIGSQVRVSSETKTMTVRFGKRPKTLWEGIKAFVCDRVPTLRFGWLVPEYEVIEKEIVVPCEEKYWNVMPLNEIPEGQDSISYARLFGEEPPYLSEPDWLNSEPPTRQEVRDAAFRGRELAFWMRK